MFWLKPNSHYTTNDGKLYGEFYADTAEDLATSLDGISIAKGSIAYVISSGAFYVFNSSGEWINSDSDSASGTKSTTLSTSTNKLTTQNDLISTKEVDAIADENNISALSFDFAQESENEEEEATE
jgi:hypothetical protein